MSSRPPRKTAPDPDAPDRTVRAWLLAWDVAKRLPAPVAHLLGRAGGALWYRSDKRRAAALRANLRQVLGSSATDAEVERLVRRAFAGYGRYWVEVFRLERLSAEQLRKRVTFPGRHHLDAAVASGRGAVVATLHVGNWDAGGAWLGAAGYQASAIVEQLKPRELYERFRTYREQLGLNIIPLTSGSEAMRGILTELRRGRVVLLVADRDLTGHGVEVEFFGRRTTLPSGPATLALRTGAVLLPGVVYQDRRFGHWRPTIPGPIEFQPTGDNRADVEALTRKLAAAMEQMIAAAPDQWYVLSPIWRDRPRRTPSPETGTGTAPDTGADVEESDGGPSDGVRRDPEPERTPDRDPEREPEGEVPGRAPDRDHGRTRA